TTRVGGGGAVVVVVAGSVVVVVVLAEALVVGPAALPLAEVHATSSTNRHAAARLIASRLRRVRP
ncbi:MAG: hypothetical protein QOD38_230, partial [Acidimicrobiaceae bacterium]